MLRFAFSQFAEYICDLVWGSVKCEWIRLLFTHNRRMSYCTRITNYSKVLNSVDISLYLRYLAVEGVFLISKLRVGLFNESAESELVVDSCEAPKCGKISINLGPVQPHELCYQIWLLLQICMGSILMSSWAFSIYSLAMLLFVFCFFFLLYLNQCGSGVYYLAKLKRFYSNATRSMLKS